MKVNTLSHLLLFIVWYYHPADTTEVVPEQPTEIGRHNLQFRAPSVIDDQPSIIVRYGMSRRKEPNSRIVIAPSTGALLLRGLSAHLELRRTPPVTPLIMKRTIHLIHLVVYWFVGVLTITQREDVEHLLTHSIVRLPEVQVHRQAMKPDHTCYM